MNLAVGAILLRKRAGSRSNKHLAETMFTFVKESFKENMKNLDWLDDEDRIVINEKVNAMGSLIGKND